LQFELWDVVDWQSALSPAEAGTEAEVETRAGMIKVNPKVKVK